MVLALIMLMASFAAALGGRAQLTVAHMALGLGRSGGLLLAGLATAALTAIAMAAAGAWLGGQASAGSQLLLVRGALVLAAADLAWPVRIAAPAEPTRSLGAITLVLAGRQLFDAPRWLAFAGGAALAEGTPAGTPAAGGAAIGAGLAMLLGWLVPARVSEAATLRALRWAMGTGCLLAALLIVYYS